MTTEKFKKDKPDIDVFDSDAFSVAVPTGPLQSTEESVDERERRWKPAKSASPESSSVFLAEDPARMDRHITAESSGVRIVKKGAQD